MTTHTLRDAIIVVSVEEQPPHVTISSETRFEYPENLDFYIYFDRPIASRVYVFLDASGEIFRLGHAPVSTRCDRVIMPSIEVANGTGTFIAVLSDAVGNRTRVESRVEVVAPQPFDLVIGMKQALIVELGQWEETTALVELDVVVTAPYGLLMRASAPYDVQGEPTGIYSMGVYRSPVFGIELGEESA